MNLIESQKWEQQKKMLTEFCPDIKSIYANHYLTERQQESLIMVALIDRLMKDGKWYEFYWWATKKRQETEILGSPGVCAWLIRPVDENGAHFCRLVADFLEKEGGKE